MSEKSDEILLWEALARIAPGTPLRDSLERILRGRTGALIVLGQDDVVEKISTGGFPLNIGFSATRLRELAKMDGAIVMNSALDRIMGAAIQLVPDSSIETHESGTRHRTAERVAKQTGFPVISVSQSMQIIAVYVGNLRHVVEGSPAILSRAGQALQTLERYKNRLDEVMGSLSALEIEDLVTVRDVAQVLQRLEMVRRIHHEISEYVVELGSDGRLIDLQLQELVGTVAGEREALLRDYLDATRDGFSLEQVDANLAALNSAELIDISANARAAGFQVTGDALDASITPRGYRLLTKVPRLPAAIVDRLVDHFGGLQALLGADFDDLLAVEGVGESRARAVREGLSRLAESSILERYV